MYDLNIKKTKNTPALRYKPESFELEIEGDSIPEDPYEFYMPLFHWMEILEDNPIDELNVNIKLGYFNTSSSKCLLDILKRFEDIAKSKKNKINIYWYYMQEDEDMEEIGREYQEMLHLPIQIKPY